MLSSDMIRTEYERGRMALRLDICSVEPNLIIIMFIRITSRTDSTIMKISGAIKTSVRAAVHNYYPKATKEKGTNSTQKTAVAYRFRKEIYRILSCT